MPLGDFLPVMVKCYCRRVARQHECHTVDIESVKTQNGDDIGFINITTDAQMF